MVCLPPDPLAVLLLLIQWARYDMKQLEDKNRQEVRWAGSGGCVNLDMLRAALPAALLHRLRVLAAAS